MSAPCENQVNKVWLLNSKFTLERVMSVWDKEPSKMASGLKMGPRTELASQSPQQRVEKKFSTLFTIIEELHSTCGAATSILTMHISEAAGAELLDKFQL